MLRMMFYRRTLILSLGVLALAIYPLTLIHEAGHFQYCLAAGGLPSMKVDVFSGRTDCQVSSDNHHAFDEFWYSFSGGALAAMVALLPVALTKRLLGSIPKWLIIPCVALSGAQLANAIIETFWTHFYLTNTDAVVLLMALPVLGIFLTGIVLFARRRVKTRPQITLDAYTEVVKQNNKPKGRWVKHVQTAGYLTMLFLGLPITGKSRKSKKWAKRQDNLRRVSAYLIGEPSQEAHASDSYVERLNALCWGKHNESH